MYIISGRGRKSGVARATGATASLSPMKITKALTRALPRRKRSVKGMQNFSLEINDWGIRMI